MCFYVAYVRHFKSRNTRKFPFLKSIPSPAEGNPPWECTVNEKPRKEFINITSTTVLCYPREFIKTFACFPPLNSVVYIAYGQKGRRAEGQTGLAKQTEHGNENMWEGHWDVPVGYALKIYVNFNFVTAWPFICRHQEIPHFRSRLLIQMESSTRDEQRSEKNQFQIKHLSFVCLNSFASVCSFIQKNNGKKICWNKNVGNEAVCLEKDSF